MTTTRLLPFLGIVLFPGLAPSADPPSIAVVDMEKVFAEHPSTDEATRELSETRDGLREEFREKSNLLKEILQRHQELIRAGNRTEAAEELKKANIAEREIAALRTTQQRDLEEDFRKAKLAIMESISTSIAAFNADGRYSLILDKSSSSSNGLPQVVHAPGAADITEEVVEFIRKLPQDDEE